MRGPFRRWLAASLLSGAPFGIRLLSCVRFSYTFALPRFTLGRLVPLALIFPVPPFFLEHPGATRDPDHSPHFMKPTDRVAHRRGERRGRLCLSGNPPGDLRSL